MSRVVVVGTGYVGLTLSVCMARLGHRVTGAEIDVGKVEQLSAGRSTIEEPGLEQLLVSGLESGQLDFSSDVAGACSSAEVVFMCLPTPSMTDGSADVRILHDVIGGIRHVLRPGAVVVNKSTVPVGTADEVAALLDRDDIAVVSNPEFLREGSAVADFLTPDRIVVGSPNQEAADTVARLYATLGAPVSLMDTRSAEMLKYAANAMLALRLSFVNQIAEICDRSGADIDAVIDGLGSDPRIGPNHLQPGPGWGGSCFPKDTRALLHHGERVGAPATLVEEAVRQNDRWISWVASSILAAVETDSVARIALWGLTFKPHTDDLRESPALRIARLLVDAGATVCAHDPTVTSPIDGHPEIGIVTSPIEAARDADVVVVLTHWPEYCDVDLEKVSEVMAGRHFFDTRASIDRLQAEAVGLVYRRPGKTPAREAPLSSVAIGHQCSDLPSAGYGPAVTTTDTVTSHAMPRGLRS
jgi:UDPglucose 6-dehydrogenase